MLVTIEIPDITAAAKAMNNATIAYGNVLSSAMLGCQVPKEFEFLYDFSDEELKNRYECVKSIYEQIEDMERIIKIVEPKN